MGRFGSVASGIIPDYRPPVSILKAVRGRDPRFYEAIRSHAVQQYPDFELIFGALPGDPAREDIERLKAEFPQVPIRVFDSTNDAPNGKVGLRSEILAREARHEVLLVNDGDILVERDYLTRVVSLLEDEQVGMVTCLYRGAAASIASRAEALGIATEVPRPAYSLPVCFRTADLLSVPPWLFALRS